MLTMRVAAYELFHEAYLQEAAVLCIRKSKYNRMLQKKIIQNDNWQKKVVWYNNKQLTLSHGYNAIHERQII